MLLLLLSWTELMRCDRRRSACAVVTYTVWSSLGAVTWPARAPVWWRYSAAEQRRITGVSGDVTTDQQSTSCRPVITQAAATSLWRHENQQDQSDAQQSASSASSRTLSTTGCQISCCCWARTDTRRIQDAWFIVRQPMSVISSIVLDISLLLMLFSTFLYTIMKRFFGFALGWAEHLKIKLLGLVLKQFFLHVSCFFRRIKLTTNLTAEN